MPPSVVFDGDRWFPDGRLNTCFNAVDRHVAAGRGEQVALVYDSPVTGVVRRYTYDELLDHVARVAGMLRELGVEAGDTVVVYQNVGQCSGVYAGGEGPTWECPLGRERALTFQVCRQQLHSHRS
ncbi:AMP-binding protein, partial [Nonomuraea sp. NPDC005983]|uniref:AMP-binding protein n=1 Tax=Nonomuraea sp. NPDC005983 TaxID=3155595 RepID=UPI0033BEDB22